MDVDVDADVDVRDPDEKSIMTYVAQFLQYSRDLPASEEEMQVCTHCTHRALICWAEFSKQWLKDISQNVLENIEAASTSFQWFTATLYAAYQKRFLFIDM